MSDGLHWCWKNFCLVLFRKKNLKRDVLILSGLIFILGSFLSHNWQMRQKQAVVLGESQKKSEEAPESQNEEFAVRKEEGNVSDIQSKIDTADWIPYQNTWYGFTLKYPQDWQSPIAERKPAGAFWEQKIDFFPKETAQDNPFSGFQVTIYNLSSVRELSLTEEFPQIKNEEMKTEEGCALIDGHLLETGDYPAEEIYVPASDPCYNAVLFFSNTRGNYIYNLSPKIKDGMGLAGDPSEEISNHLPEFFAVAAQWNLIDIHRPKPAPVVPVKPKIDAPMPVYYSKDSAGRLVCSKENDYPAKSNKGKGKHLDMECCLDPDEYPNPHCYYPPEKYGKYLK
jgi:hypothetical protein